MNVTDEKTGLYIHVPFCASKCRYCDFYSVTGYDDSLLDRYTEKVCEALALWREDVSGRADTLYFGGGTPPLLGAGRIAKIIDCAADMYGLGGAEITIEANPNSVDDTFLREVRKAGVNRVSLGLQSASKNELALLGRKHEVSAAASAVESARNAGIDNISVDIMLGVMRQNIESAIFTADFVLSLGVRHISAYMLKVEEGTPLYNHRDKYDIPKEEEVSDIYLEVCRRLGEGGFEQYEISNFAMPGFECRHNMKYWRLAPYLGIGPAAHSMLRGKRFYYERDLCRFLKEDIKNVTYEGEAGGPDEYLMLRLRLREGLSFADFGERYGTDLAAKIKKKAQRLVREGLAAMDDGFLRLDTRGFLVSNSIISYLLY